MSEWIERELDDVILKRNQGVNTTTEKVKYSETGIKVIRANNISQGRIDYSDCVYVDGATYSRIKEPCKPKKGDILYTNIGSQFGNAAKVEVDFEFTIAWNVLRIQPNDDIDSDFLVYLLNNPVNKRYIQSLNSSSTMPFVSGKDIGKTLYKFPSYKTQKEIGKKLKSFDLKIELNRQTNQTLEHIAQAIFKSWFVDFEPTRAKIAAKQNGQDPERAAMAAISRKSEAEIDQLISEHDVHGCTNVASAGSVKASLEQLKTTAALFPVALVDSELGEIPEGWECSEIGDEIVVAGGGTPSTKKEEFWEGGHIHWTSPKDMSNLTDKILLDTSRKITEAGLAKISSGLLPENTVLMSSRAPVGYLAITKIPVAINQGYIAMKCEGTLSPEYVVQWAESVMDDIKQRASGTTFAEISKKSFKIIPVVVPEKEVINSYTTVVSGIYDKVSESLSETRLLTEIRDTLLPKLLSGEIELVG